MTILSWAEFIATRELAPLSVTIGVFDGVHLGHMRLLDTVLSKSPSMKSSVITFKDNPKKVLHPQSFKGSIFSMEQKLDVFAGDGEACAAIRRRLGNALSMQRRIEAAAGAGLDVLVPAGKVA